MAQKAEKAEKADRAAIVKAQQTLYEEGTKLRREVFGSGYISQSQTMSDFLQPLQTMAVAAGWSLCWTRPGLERKTRSLLCLVMLAVLGRDHELGVHVRGALSNGCTQEEIQEALFQVSASSSYCRSHADLLFLQVSVYAGVPAAMQATRIAWGVLEDVSLSGAGIP